MQITSAIDYRDFRYDYIRTHNTQARTYTTIMFVCTRVLGQFHNCSVNSTGNAFWVHWRIFRGGLPGSFKHPLTNESVPVWNAYKCI